MLTRVSSFSRNGLLDWLLQRFTAYLLFIYALFVMVVIFDRSEGTGLTFAEWRLFMSSLSMKIFTMLAVLSVVVHAWIGVWTVITDYITASKVGGASHALTIRAVFMMLIVVTSLVYLVWTADILWGIPDVA
jgi:succinate dehydrogenase / fumarate reductase membrane anchor subunit